MKRCQQALLARLAAAVRCGPSLPWADLAAACVDLARTIAGRDLGDLPLYLLDSAEMPAGLQAAPDMDAFTSASLHWLAREAIGDRWAGPGPCIVFNNRRLAEQNAPDFVAVATIGLFIHELGHVLAEDWLGTICRRPPRELLEQIAAAATHELATPPAGRPAAELLPTLRQHRADRWGRTTLHLLARARALGIAVPPSRVCWPSFLEPVVGYWTALVLDDEPHRLRAATFTEILASDPPATFAAAWQRDLDSFTEAFGEAA